MKFYFKILYVFSCFIVIYEFLLVCCWQRGIYSLLQGNGLHFDRVTEADTGIYTCYLDNFVQPVVSYKFSLMVEGKTISCCCC